MVEHGTENAGVPSSTLGLSTNIQIQSSTITSGSFRWWDGLRGATLRTGACFPMSDLGTAPHRRTDPGLPAFRLSAPEARVFPRAKRKGLPVRPVRAPPEPLGNKVVNGHHAATTRRSTMLQQHPSISLLPSKQRGVSREVPVEPARRAMVLSADGAHSINLLPVLAGLSVTVIDRPYSPGWIDVAAAVDASLVVVLADPVSVSGRAIITDAAEAGLGRLLVVDCGRSPEGVVLALELGADAAFTSREDARAMRATIHAMLRRHGSGPTTPAAAALAPEQLMVGDLVVDLAVYEARVGDEAVPLTRTEFLVLAQLARQPERVLTASEILSNVYDYAFTDYEAQQNLKVYVRRIRRKLEACKHQAVEILNTRSFGYRLAPIGAPGSAAA